MANEIRIFLHYKPAVGRGWAARMKWWRVEVYDEGRCVLHDDICSVKPETAVKRFKSKHHVEGRLRRAA